MAKKGGNKKLKRLAAPRTWKIKRKEKKWIIKPMPGPHSLENGIALGVLLRDILGLAKTAREAKYIIKGGKVKIDGKIRKSLKFPVGFMDTVSILGLDKYYRIVYDKLGRLDVTEINRDEANKKLVKVINKTMVRGGKIQLNLHDGRNILTEDRSIKTGDSLLITLPEQKIVDVIKLEKGNLAYVTSGSHTGEMAKITDILPGTMTRPPLVKLKKEGKEILTNRKNVFVVGKDNPVITIG